MTTILITDDDPHIRELVCHFLTREGYQVLEAADGAEALKRLDSEKADLAVIDVMMPNMDGWQLCRELREHYDVPVLMLTAKSETRDKVKGFDLGAEDYLVKPFDPLELIVRVRALLKRYRIAASQTVQAGGLMMNRATFELSADGKSVTLPLKEFELLFRLASCPGVTCARDTLLEQVWGFDYEGNERTLDVHINRLREKFPEEQHSFRVKTIRGLGYRLEVKA
ncbi:Heme response regulator HssR [Paenibacillus solanacearum]|uniref:Heme response regulator HssR n=1 Tax=Paenibacillus solanacearum TaxID=2048548 RepID=A0A916NI77_9BACL|nr:response regulator transcription factor [Paenibacillus solanacearum]CAG7619198.1 Heme response regulator HssR [Paenibacillus solanacearum]